MSDIVFILGAGASADCGAPLIKDFLNKAQDIYYNDTTNYRGDSDLKFVIETIDSLPIVHSKANLDLHNIEEVFSAIEMGLLINKICDLDKTTIKKLPHAIRKLLTITLERSIEFESDVRGGARPTGTYDQFAKLIKGIIKSQASCSIITFNYDIALDFALQYNELHPNYYLDSNSKTNF